MYMDLWAYLLCRCLNASNNQIKANIEKESALKG